MEKELRYITEVRAAEEEGVIKGTAIVFNADSQDLGGFIERILPEAVTDELLLNSDIIMKYNHLDTYLPLARKKAGTMNGTLKVRKTETGVDFEFKCKNKDLGIYESVKAGDLDSCSFAFRIAEGGDKWEKRADGKYLRTINAFQTIADMSIVNQPAYQQTSVDVRKIDELKQQEADNIAEQQRQADEKKVAEDKKKADFEKYYKNLVAKYLK